MLNLAWHDRRASWVHWSVNVKASTEASASESGEQQRKKVFLPREHGATAMLITPIVCAAILARQWRWAEVATLTAAFAALAIKDPMVLLVRQRFIRKQQRPEAAAAGRWFAGWLTLLVASGLVLLRAWPTYAVIALGTGLLLFSALAVLVNVKNKQRSTLFQIASALALTSTSLATCISALGFITEWCWWLWILLAMQATAGILVVHARLDARIALRRNAPVNSPFRGAAQMAIVVLLCAAVAAAVLRRGWIATALVVAVIGYSYDLRCQKSASSLQLPLKKVGQRALALSSLYALLLILGIW